MIVLTSYKNPDIDGIAGMYSLKELYNILGINCNYYIFGKPQYEVDIVCKKYNIQLSNIKEFNKNDKFILLDCNDLTNVSKKIKSENVIKVIDHHNTSLKTNDLKNAKMNIQQVGAMATLIVEKFIKNNIKISQNSAILLYHAIASNTINLKAPVTTNRDKKAFKYLEMLYPNIINKNCINKVFQKKSDIKNIQRTVLSDLKIYENNIVIAQLEITNIENFVLTNLDELKKTLAIISKNHNTNNVVLNIIDILKGFNIILFLEETNQIRKLIKNNRFKSFNNAIKTKNIIMRKDIVQER